MKKILIVDDEQIIRELLKELLKELIEVSFSIDVDIAEEGNEALALCKKHDYQLILTDTNMPNGMNGEEFVQCLIKEGFDNNICVMSGYNENQYLTIKKYVKKFFKKPLKPSDMFSELKELIVNE